MPVDREQILRVAQKLVDKKRYDKAIVEYQKLVADDPGDVRTLLKIGDLYLKTDQHEDAIKTYEQVGEYYYREGFSVKAIAVYKQIRGIITRRAKHLEGRYGHIGPRLAEIYTQLGLISDALAAYDEVATRLRQDGRERDALDIFKKVLDIDPQNPIAHLRVADSRARLGEINRAVAQFGEAARIMIKLGRHDDALKVLQRLLEYRQEPEYALMAGKLYLEQGTQSAAMLALKMLQICFKANPKDLETLAVLAQAFDAIKQPKKAVEVLKESARIAQEIDDREALDTFVDTLLQRAPDAPLVIQLHQHRLQQVEPAAESTQIEMLDDSELLVEESVPSIEDLLRNRDQLLTALAQGSPGAVLQLIEQADAIANAGGVAQAVALLRDGTRTAGQSVELRTRLSDLLLETGDELGAIAEKLVLGRLLVDSGDSERAAMVMDDVLLLQPDNAEALRLHGDIARRGLPSEEGIGDLQLDSPLRSYDVEAGGVAEALSRSGGYPQAPAAAVVAIDEPFMEAGTASQPLAPQLDEAALERADALAAQGQYEQARQVLAAQLQLLPNHPLILERLADVDQLAEMGRLSYLPEAEHSVSLYPDAPEYQYDPATAGGSGSYPQAAAGYPEAAASYPETYDYDAAYDGQAAYEAYGEYDGRASGAYDAQAAGAYPDASYQNETAAYHEAQAAGTYDAQAAGAYPDAAAYQDGAAADASGAYPNAVEAYLEPQGSAYDAAGASSGAMEDQVSEIFEQFKAGVKAQVSDADSQTHYDLGVAYCEMGLHRDAINELSLAARDPARECNCMSMIANIYMQLGDPDQALEALNRAWNCEHKTQDEELAVAYEIADIYEFKQMPQQALEYFEWLASIEPDFMHPFKGTVTERINRLRTESGAQRRPEAPGLDLEDELGGAMDDLFGTGGSSTGST